jgi:hypothetical protein
MTASMQRVVYISFTCPGHLGVRQKNEAQARAWQRVGLQARFVNDLCGAGTVLKLLHRYWVFLKYFVLRAEPGARVYLRQTQCLPGMALLASFRAFYYEVNADIARENLTLRGVRGWVARQLRDRFVEKAAGVFFVSAEIRDRTRGVAGRAYVFPNALKAAPSASKPAPRGNKVVFVGDGRMPWQGVDLALQLAERLPDYEFHFIGEVGGHPVPGNVRVHGEQRGEAYQAMMAGMDFAVGTLAFHRSGLSEGSPLKVRDYVQFNLPVVVGYVDSDFEGTDFLLRVDTEDLDGSARRMREFFTAWKERPLVVLRDSSCLYDTRECERAAIIMSGGARASR